MTIHQPVYKELEGANDPHSKAKLGYCGLAIGV